MTEIKHFQDRPIPKSIAIVAMGASRIDYGTRAGYMGGYKAAADEVWAINRMGGVVFNDILWRMDDLRHITSEMTPEYERVLKEHPCVVTSTVYPEFPNSIAYPLEEVLQDIEIPYFKTTPAYALAYAVYLRIPEIHIYGCDYTYPNQNMAEEGRGNFEMLMGIAYARKLALCLGPNTSLFDTCVPMPQRFYGYNNSITAVNPDGRWKIISMQEQPVSLNRDVEKENDK